MATTNKTILMEAKGFFGRSIDPRSFDQTLNEQAAEGFVLDNLFPIGVAGGLEQVVLIFRKDA